MAVNKPYGDNARRGAVREREQYFNPQNGRYVKMNSNTGKFINVKSDKKPFKGVRKKII